MAKALQSKICKQYEPADLGTFTEEILNGKFHILYMNTFMFFKGFHNINITLIKPRIVGLTTFNLSLNDFNPCAL